MRPNLLILGGTTEASALAALVARRGIAGTLSYAGRVERPRQQPIPCRTGGFGGPSGLVAWLRTQRVTHVVDATHPFAARMSRNAVAAREEAGVPLAALVRPPWTPEAGDHWIEAADIPAAVAALSGSSRRVMLAVGRQSLADFAVQPQHHYLLRVVDPLEQALPFPNHSIVVSRGPFTVEGDIALMREHRIELVVSKNSGGTGASAKVEAARALGLPVLMIARPPMPKRHEVTTPEAALDWVAHAGTDLGV
jgi:precorrin-6A/cobalt-precorrin-6A reductase